MAIEIVESSPAAAETKSKKVEKRGEMYPFEELQSGQSFTVPFAECNWKSLRVLVYKRNARFKGEREFAFLKHDNLELCEVARIA